MNELNAKALELNPIITGRISTAGGMGVEQERLSAIVAEFGWDHAQKMPEVERFMTALKGQSVLRDDGYDERNTATNPIAGQYLNAVGYKPRVGDVVSWKQGFRGIVQANVTSVYDDGTLGLGDYLDHSFQAEHCMLIRAAEVAVGNSCQKCHVKDREFGNSVCVECRDEILGRKSLNPKDVAGSMKPPVELFPAVAIIEGAMVLQNGAAKYGPFNWRNQPIGLTFYTAAIQRHCMAINDGQDIDPESGRPHLAHILATAAIVLDAIACGTLTDNRPMPGHAPRLLKELTREKPRDAHHGSRADVAVPANAA